MSLGRRGEDWVAALLTARGWQVLRRNFRTRRGEIDIIAREGSVVVFVEVRARCSAGRGSAQESVGSLKLLRLTRAAAVYLCREPDAPHRFDLVALEVDPLSREILRHEHLRNITM